MVKTRTATRREVEAVLGAHKYLLRLLYRYHRDKRRRAELEQVRRALRFTGHHYAMITDAGYAKMVKRHERQARQAREVQS